MRPCAFFAAMLLAITPALHAQTTNAAPATNAPATKPSPPNPYPDAIPAEKVIGKAESTLAHYTAPSNPGAPDPTESDIREAMSGKYSQFQEFVYQTSQLLAQNPSLDRIRFLDDLGNFFAADLSAWTSSVTGRTDQIAKQQQQLSADQKTWQETQAALKNSNPPASPEITNRAADVLARLASVKRDLGARQDGLLALESEISNESTYINGALDQLNRARDKAISQLFENNAPPVWSGAPETSAAELNAQGWSKQAGQLISYIQAQPGKFLIHGILFALLAVGFYWLQRYARQLTAQEPGIAPAARFFEMPIATAALLSLFASPLLYYPIAPRLLSAILGALALIPSVIVLRRLIEPRLFPVLNALVVFFFLEEFRSVASMPPAGARAFLLTEILGAACFLAWLLLALRRGGATQRFSKTMRFGAWTAFAALAAGWLAEVLGFTLLANLVCVAVQRSATLALALYAGIRIVEAILFIGMRLRPLSSLGMVRMHGPMLLRRVQRALVWVAVIVWVLALLDQFSLRSEVLGRLGAFLATYESDHHRLVLTLAGKIVAAVLIGWAVYQLSRFGRFALETDFYPRLHFSPGIPYAISTSLHYAMLVVAFIGATYALGIDMTKFTILVSALGVGVGFGLQTIINNFVSGLILLFERPIKIGDSVQNGDAVGVVERIGIRASVLRTAAGTEIIVPNASLISNNVTNWTLSSEERIILIPLNVPRGPDSTRLIELLTTTAAANPKVLKHPAPQVVAQTLGANLGLELRAWAQAGDNWSRIRSDLVLAIYAALAKENITLA